MIAISASSARRNVGSFQKSKILFFLQSSKGEGVDSRALSFAYATVAHLRDLAPGDHRNVAAVASCWRHCADFAGPVIEPQTSRIDSLCA